MRPVAIFEQSVGEAQHCVERITWGDASDEDAAHNRCGQPVRHDDPAGSRLMPDYGMANVILADVRHFLVSLDPPDWPAAEAERDRLLEPGEGACSAWHFAASGESISQTDAKGHARQFVHDRAGQLRKVCLQRAGQADIETLVSAIEYNEFGQVMEERAGNGMCTTSAYDPANGYLLSLATQSPDGRFLQDLSYRQDAVGNITEIADAALSVQHFANQRIDPVRRFEYDTLYRLIKATGWETTKPSFGPALPEWQPFGPPDASRWCNYSETYDYDAAGNLLERIHLGAENDTLIMQVAAYSNRSIKDRPDANPEALFDARGNLRELQPGQRLQWNGRNELAQVTLVARAKAADDQERYVYDSSGQRVRKWRSAAAKSSTRTTEVRYLPGIELHTNSATGEAFHVSTVEAGRCSVRLLHWDSSPPDGIENDQLRFCFDDHLGSTAVEVDARAKAISQEVFYPYGGTAWRAGRHEVETGYKTIRYSGKERDATGLYYYGARYYAPWLQRWLNPDPAGDVDGLNFFRFVRNSPIVYVDRRGSYGILARLNDFMVERHREDHVLVERRGMKSIRQHQPKLADAIIQAFEVAKNILEDVVLELDGNELDFDVIKAYFGEITSDGVEHLSRGYKDLLVSLQRYEKKSEKIVAFSDVGSEGRRGAFVYPNDRRRKIYVNSEVFVRDRVGRNAHSIIHELTHLSRVFNSEDLWYLKSPNTESFESEKMDELQYVVMKGQSIKKMAGVGLSEEGDKAVLDYFILAAGAESIDEANEKFKQDPALRTHLAINNADTLAAFAKGLSRSRQNRLMP